MLSFGSVEQILACTCGKSRTCERYNFASAVFIGKAINIEKESIGGFKTESTIFEIKESFLGKNSPKIKVRNKSGFSCDVEFEKGRTYLIFAGGDQENGFGTGFCSGNLPIEYADEEILNLRNLIASDKIGTLSGTILEELVADDRDSRKPISDIRVNAREISNRKLYSGFSNAEGRYEIPVPAGKYKIDLTLPKYMESKFFDEKEVLEVKNRGCAEGFYVLINNSKISGKILDVTGKPVSNVKVELISTDEKKSYDGGKSTDTDKNGIFTMTQVPTGNYTLSINYNSSPSPDSPFPTVFYPASSIRENAMIFEVSKGKSIENLVFQLPLRLKQKEIKGEVLWEDGSPAKNVEIRLEDVEFEGFSTGCYLKEITNESLGRNPETFISSSGFVGSGCDLKTDEFGRFTIKGYASRKYKVFAEVEKKVNKQKVEYEAESNSFTLGEETIFLKLTLKEKLEK